MIYDELKAKYCDSCFYLISALLRMDRVPLQLIG